MSTKLKVVLIVLGMAGLFVLAGVALVRVNWEALPESMRETLDEQGEKLQVTLFRAGELMSIGAEIERTYRADPDMEYDTDTGVRVLSISFNEFAPPDGITPADHAREIAAFAVGKTARADEIDVVVVRFGSGLSAEGDDEAGQSGSHSFTLDELTARGSSIESEGGSVDRTTPGHRARGAFDATHPA